MESLLSLFGWLFDFIIHIDVHLTAFVAEHGTLVYALLFLIIFVETGLVVMPFLPGDSLLFMVGALAGQGMLNLPLAMALMLIAAVAGDQCNYTIGHWLGPKVFKWEQSRFFNKKAFDAAHGFYDKYGGFTVIVARFMPFIRTFVPFVAGVAFMTRARFIFFNVIGAVLWVCGVTTLGYLFGGIEIIKDNFEKVIWGLILIPGLIALFGAWKASRKAKVNAAQVDE